MMVIVIAMAKHGSDDAIVIDGHSGNSAGGSSRSKDCSW